MYKIQMVINIDDNGKKRKVYEIRKILDEAFLDMHINA